MRLEVRLVVIKEYQIYKRTFIECRFKIVHEHIVFGTISRKGPIFS